jgi:hypothetical protein
VHHPRKDFSFYVLENFGVTKKTRDIDQEVSIERLDFARILRQAPRVVGRRVLILKRHAAQDPSPNRAFTIVTEIDVCRRMN